MTAILGISAFYHDAAAALLVDGEIVAAAQEERFSRKKHDPAFPARAVAYCLETAGLRPDQLDYVGFYDKPLLKFERLLETYLAYAPRGFGSFLMAMPVWLKHKLHLRRELRSHLPGYRNRLVFTEHHESHAASAFYPSPYEEAAILTLDGVGEWATGSWGTGRGNTIELTHQLDFPHSIGLLYSAFTYFTGFAVNSGEYKLMGLAPYGEPTYVDRILASLLDLKDDGSFRMDQRFFDYCAGLKMTSSRFDALFDGPRRAPEDPITQREMDIAASIQKVTEEIMLRTARHVHAQTGMRHLCLAGGVALNCVGNGRILREGPFEDVWIQPAAGDAGGALGVAQFIWHQLLEKPRTPRAGDGMSAALLGPSWDEDQIAAFLRDVGATAQTFDDEAALCDHVAGVIEDGRVIGWFQRRMEFGPRALGSRSILGDARDAQMQHTINMMVKFREGFRPFAPVVLRDRAHEWFNHRQDTDSSYMLVVQPVLDARRRELSEAEAGAVGLDKLRVKRSEIPAVTHVDFSARIQTVDAERHGPYHGVLEAFHRRTGCPVLINTSFNLGWEPIVCSPADAYRTFVKSGIDVLVLGRHVIDKRAQRIGPALAAQAEGPRGLADLWQSPCCAAALTPADDEGLTCDGCSRRFAVDGGVPQLAGAHPATDAATDIARRHHDAAPRPSYDDIKVLASLLDRIRKAPGTGRLYEDLPFDATILEVGCGTGRLANALGTGFRRVVAVDISPASLAVGEAFRVAQKLANVRFAQMNLFALALREAAFDVVLCVDTVQETADPAAAVAALCSRVRPGGHLVLGLRRAGHAPAGAPPGGVRPDVGQATAWLAAAGAELVRTLPAAKAADDGGHLLSPMPPAGTFDRWRPGRGRLADGMLWVVARRPEGS